MTTETLHRAAATAAPLIERGARLGYAAIGVVYLVIGCVTAVAGAQHAASWTDAIVKVGAMPLGTIAVMAIAIGLAGYATWLVTSAITDSEHRGNDVKGFAFRAGNVISAIVHAAIAVTAIRFVLTHRAHDSSDVEMKAWTARVMAISFGPAAIAVTGIVLIGYAVWAFYAAWKSRLSHSLHIPAIPAKALLVAICRFGVAARAIVISVIGTSLLFAALHRNPAISKSTKGALEHLSRKPHGHPFLMAVSIGLAAYGVYEIVKARYRTIRAT